MPTHWADSIDCAHDVHSTSLKRTQSRDFWISGASPPLLHAGDPHCSVATLERGQEKGHGQLRCSERRAQQQCMRKQISECQTVQREGEILHAHRERKGVNAAMGRAFTRSLESWDSWSTITMESPFALNKWFRRAARGRDAAQTLHFYLLVWYFETLTKGTMWLIEGHKDAQSEHILAQSKCHFQKPTW